MTLELNEQEHQYLLQVLMQRPAQESLPMILKLTGQQLTPVQPPRGQNEAMASALGDLRAAKG